MGSPPVPAPSRLHPAERARLAAMAAVIFILNASGWAIFVLTVMPHHFQYARLGAGRVGPDDGADGEGHASRAMDDRPTHLGGTPRS